MLTLFLDLTIGIKALHTRSTPYKDGNGVPSSQFREGHSTQRPPLFNGSNYNYWKYRMKIYLQSLNYELWNIVEATYTKPTINYSAWNEEQKKSTNLDAKAMNFLCLEQRRIQSRINDQICKSNMADFTGNP